MATEGRCRRFKAFLKGHKGILLLMAALLFLRLLILYQLGFCYSIESDDLSYVQSGINFAKTGVVSMHDSYPSAQIMPGMTWLIGAVSLVFGEGTLFWAVLKLIWILMGTATAWFIYKSVTLFAPKWCGLIAAACLFDVQFIWTDNVILTETPCALFLSASVYFTLKMGGEAKPVFYRLYHNFYGRFSYESQFWYLPVFCGRLSAHHTL